MLILKTLQNLLYPITKIPWTSVQMKYFTVEKKSLKSEQNICSSIAVAENFINNSIDPVSRRDEIKHHYDISGMLLKALLKYVYFKIGLWKIRIKFADRIMQPKEILFLTVLQIENQSFDFVMSFFSLFNPLSV